MLEVQAIIDGLLFLSSSNLHHPLSIVVEYDAKEVVKLIKNYSIDFIEVMNAVEEFWTLASRLRPFSYCHRVCNKSTFHFVGQYAIRFTNYFGIFSF